MTGHRSPAIKLIIMRTKDYLPEGVGPMPEQLEAKADDIKIGRYASLLMDRMFKRAFGTEQGKPLLTLFLQALLPERDIVKLELTSQEHINENDEDKDIRVDVECVDSEGRRFMVEMQKASQRGFRERAIFNSSFAIQSQIRSGVQEYLFPAVYFIGVLNFSIHKGSDKVLYRYTLQERDSHELMSDRLEYLFLELPNCQKAGTPEASELDNLCYALLNMSTWDAPPKEVDSKLIDELLKSAEIATFAPELRIRYIQDMTTEQDIRNQIKYALETGREEGMAEGMADGMAKGMAEGRVKGREEERECIARNLLSSGVDYAVVAKATGLSEEKLRSL